MHDQKLELTRQYRLVSQAIGYIRGHVRQQPSLEEVASAVHLSPFHLQRLFSEWAGISPKRFLQFLTKEYAKNQLIESQSVLSVSENIGLSSTSRLHDLMVTCEALTPGEIQAKGQGLDICFGLADSPFGEAIVGWTARGVCHFAFSVADQQAMQSELFESWPHAHFKQDTPGAAALMRQIFPDSPQQGKVHLLLRGTNFQLKVWEALLAIAPGQILSYQQLAQKTGSPKASRAVGSAMAANQIGFLIPCHRVIQHSGEVGNYRWGTERKLAMLAWEAGRASPAKTN